MPGDWRRAAVALVGFAAVAGCTVETNWFGRRPPPPKRFSDNWSANTAAGTQALQKGDLSEAERRFEAARSQAAVGSDDLAEATSLTNLAALRRAQGDTQAAITLHQQALAIRERVLGREHPDVATTLTSLAATYTTGDDYAVAEPLLQRALAIREQALGPDHRYTGQSLSNLALLYAAQGRYPDAEPLYHRAIAVFERGPGRFQGDLAVTLENYAALLSDTGRSAEAKAAESRARALRAADAARPAAQ